jgi:hypothetical protein
LPYVQIISLLCYLLFALQAFGLNLYNLMIKYAQIKVGVGTSATGRSAFYHKVKFNCGGFIFSFQDWEHGILRGNRKAPYNLGRPFKKGDPRLALAVNKPDGRLHFALNCGASSCSPVKTYSPDHLKDELAVVAASFCENDENVHFDIKKKQLHVSKLFNWYRPDFVADCGTSSLAHILVTYTRGTKQQKLAALRSLTAGKVKVSYQTYNWSPLASDYLVFHPKSLKNKQPRLKCLAGCSPKPVYWGMLNKGGRKAPVKKEEATTTSSASADSTPAEQRKPDLDFYRNKQFEHQPSSAIRRSCSGDSKDSTLRRQSQDSGQFCEKQYSNHSRDCGSVKSMPQLGQQRIRAIKRACSGNSAGSNLRQGARNSRNCGSDKSMPHFGHHSSSAMRRNHSADIPDSKPRERARGCVSLNTRPMNRLPTSMGF